MDNFVSFYGSINNDAELTDILTLARAGQIRLLQQRISSRASSNELLGCGFIYDCYKSQIRRWSDGLCWTDSSTRGEFLLYRECEVVEINGEKVKRKKLDGVRKKAGADRLAGSNLRIVFFYNNQTANLPLRVVLTNGMCVALDHLKKALLNNPPPPLFPTAPAMSNAAMEMSTLYPTEPMYMGHPNIPNLSNVNLLTHPVMSGGSSAASISNVTNGPSITSSMNGNSIGVSSSSMGTMNSLVPSLSSFGSSTSFNASSSSASASGVASSSRNSISKAMTSLQSVNTVNSLTMGPPVSSSAHSISSNSHRHDTFSPYESHNPLPPPLPPPSNVTSATSSRHISASSSTEDSEEVYPPFIAAPLILNTQNENDPIIEIHHPKGTSYVYLDHFTSLQVQYRGTNADFAEYMECEPDEQEHMVPGTVVNLYRGKLTTSHFEDDFILPRIISTKPLVLGNDDGSNTSKVMVAMVGQVPVLVKGPVCRGDFLIAGRQFNEVRAISSQSEECFENYGRIVALALEDSNARDEEALGVRSLIFYSDKSALRNVPASVLAEWKKHNGNIMDIEKNHKSIFPMTDVNNVGTMYTKLHQWYVRHAWIIILVISILLLLSFVTIISLLVSCTNCNGPITPSIDDMICYEERCYSIALAKTKYVEAQRTCDQFGHKNMAKVTETTTSDEVEVIRSCAYFHHKTYHSWVDHYLCHRNNTCGVADPDKILCQDCNTYSFTICVADKDDLLRQNGETVLATATNTTTTTTTTTANGIREEEKEEEESKQEKP